jgi:hypothetical protein
MWVFTNNAFISIVQDRDMADQLWARARIKGDLETFFNLSTDLLEVIETADADYRWRCVVDRQLVKVALIKAVDEIDYKNFKNSIPTTKKGNMRHDNYLRVWTVMKGYQEAFARRFRK